MTTIQGVVGRAEPAVTADFFDHAGVRSFVQVSATHLNVQVLDASGNVVEDHDCSGITWRFPALGVVVGGDEVELTYDSDFHITAFRITKHY